MLLQINLLTAMAINYEAAFEYLIFMVRFSDMPNILLSNT